MNLRFQQIILLSSYMMYNLKPTNSSVHENGHHHQTKKFYTYKINDFTVSFIGRIIFLILKNV